MFNIKQNKKQEQGQIKLGTRVIRGPDWNHKYEDNGEGFLGTIVAFDLAERRVKVIWDTGRSGQYRADTGQYDLRIFDNSPTGELHHGTMCYYCSDSPIHGMKWTCTQCNIDMCTPCYMNDKHDEAHGFERTDTLESKRQIIGPLTSCTKRVTVKGIFKGAEVVRNSNLTHDLESDDGDVGYVEEVTHWQNKYHRGIVSVFWKANNTTQSYRLGAEGCVDVFCSRLTETASGGTCYVDNLPVVEFSRLSNENADHVTINADEYLEWQLKWRQILRISSTAVTKDVIIEHHRPENETWKGHWQTQSVLLEVFATESYKDALRQASIMCMCDHDNVVKFLGITHELQWIIIEWFSSNNLSEMLSTDAKDVFNISKVLDIAAQIANGMAYLGTNRIIHRNLKASQILIDHRFQTKISGFRLAVIPPDDTDVVMDATNLKTLPISWTAVDVFMCRSFTVKADVWSYGILLTELVSHGRVPYAGILKGDLELLKNIKEGYRHPQPENCPDVIYNMMLKCWKRRPEDRPTFDHLYKFFDSYVVVAEPVWAVYRQSKPISLDTENWRNGENEDYTEIVLDEELVQRQSTVTSLDTNKINSYEDLVPRGSNSASPDTGKYSEITLDEQRNVKYKSDLDSFIYMNHGEDGTKNDSCSNRSSYANVEELHESEASVRTNRTIYMNHGDSVKRYEVCSNKSAYENIVELHESEASSTANRHQGDKEGDSKRSKGDEVSSDKSRYDAYDDFELGGSTDSED
ncbi:Hypothetical predicted protein [Mytilus galloprovincialis]|uniref:Uncharacterized protein n=1 Tax=Mytilus galloprovincialis TaxID=29158 RepID=A0A8B6F667_MYTGA|nr:Hypothetical predicted protein [Mytilus galloprovincialis]